MFVDAVEQEVVLDRPLPITVETGLPLNVAERGQHSCGERRQLRKVPAVQRQLTDLRSADRMRQGGRVGLEKRRRAANRNRIVDGSQFELNVQPRAGVRVNLDRVADRPLESGDFD